MRIFLDTEFTGLNQHTTLISIGLAAENGAIFYAEFTDYNKSQVNNWLISNVLLQLSGKLSDAGQADVNSVHFCQGSTEAIAKDLRLWLAQFGGKVSVEIWADVMAWDWILFCEIFGGAFSLPEQVHYIPRDLSTLLIIKGIDPDITREKLGNVTWSHATIKIAKHHALYDALLEKDIFEKIY
jgi:hypothetical protein